MCKEGWTVVSQGERGIDSREIVRRWSESLNAKRDGIDLGARELTEDERNFTNAIESALKDREWATVTPEISELIGLQEGWQNEARALPAEALHRIRERGEYFENPQEHSLDFNTPENPEFVQLQDILNQPHLLADPRVQTLRRSLEVFLAPNPGLKARFFHAVQQKINMNAIQGDQMNYHSLRNILDEVARSMDNAEGTNLYERLSYLPR